MRIGRVGVFAGLALLLCACAEAPQAPVSESDFHRSPLCEAIAFERYDAALQLAREGADVKAAYGCALPWAAQRGQLELTRLILDRGADPNRRPPPGLEALLGTTPLSQSVGSHKVEIVRLMLDRGAKARDDFDALAFAALYGDAATLELLLARGANPNVKSKEKHRVFIVEGTRSFEVPPRDLEPDRIDATVKSLKCRIGYPADDPGVLYLVSRGRTAKGPGNYPQIVKVLLRAGADPNARTLNGATPLMRAASDQDLDVMNALIDGGADIKAVDRCGRSAADYADLNPRHPRADQAPWTKALLEQRSKK